MSTLVIKNLDDALLKDITEIAMANRISVEEQAVRLLTQTAQKYRHTDRAAVLEAIAAMTPKNIRQTDSLEMLREDRDR